MPFRIRDIVAGTVVGLALASCGGGGSTPSSTGTVIAQGTTTLSTSLQVAGTAFTPTLSSSTLSTLGLSSAPALTLPFTIADNGTATISSSAPSGVTTLSSAQALFTQGHRQKADASKRYPVFYVWYTPNSDVVLSNTGGQYESFINLQQAPISGASYGIAFYAGGTWYADSTQTETSSGNTLNINGNIPANTTLTAGATYGFAVYYTLSSTASVSPSPSPSAGASANPSASATPSASASPSASATPSAGATAPAGTASVDGNAGTTTVKAEVPTGLTNDWAHIFGTVGDKTLSFTLAPLSNGESDQSVSYSFMSNLPANSGLPEFSASGKTLLGYVAMQTPNWLDFATDSSFKASVTGPVSELNTGELHMSWYSYNTTDQAMEWLTNMGTSTSDLSGSVATLSTNLPVSSCSQQCYVSTANQNTFVAFYK